MLKQREERPSIRCSSKLLNIVKSNFAEKHLFVKKVNVKSVKQNTRQKGKEYVRINVRCRQEN